MVLRRTPSQYLDRYRKLRPLKALAKAGLRKADQAAPCRRDPQEYAVRFKELDPTLSRSQRVRMLAEDLGVSIWTINRALRKTATRASSVGRRRRKSKVGEDRARRFRGMDPGLTYADRVVILAREDGVAVTTMKASLWRAGIVAAQVDRPGETPRPRRTAGEYAARYRELPDDLSYRQKVRRIRLDFGVYPNAVRYALKRMGITPD